MTNFLKHLNTGSRTSSGTQNIIRITCAAVEVVTVIKSSKEAISIALSYISNEAHLP